MLPLPRTWPIINTISVSKASTTSIHVCTPTATANMIHSHFIHNNVFNDPSYVSQSNCTSSYTCVQNGPLLYFAGATGNAHSMNYPYAIRAAHQTTIASHIPRGLK